MSEITDTPAGASNSAPGVAGAAIDAATAAQFASEHERMDIRRTLLGLKDPDEPAAPYGLALSGGGIRSATFALGVLQAMARAAPPPAANAQEAATPYSSLLQRFDYLSTVSGGGYIGAFFIALFLPDRNRAVTSADKHQQHVDAAQQAYAALTLEPPGKIHTDTNYQDPALNPGTAALAWLRENGRYLLAAGAGDAFYVLALSVRNLLSLHFVIGMPIVAVLSALAMWKMAVNPWLHDALLGYAPTAALLVNGTLWWMSLAWLGIAIIPGVIAFWMVYSVDAEDDEVQLVNGCSVVMAIIMVAFALVAGVAPLPSTLCWLFYFGALEILLALLLFIWTLRDLHGGSSPLAVLGNGVRRYRVVITRRLSQQLMALAVLAFVAAVEQLTTLVYGWLHQNRWSALATLVGPALIPVIRWCAKLLDDKDKPGWVSKVPLDLFAGLVGFVILLSMAVLWGLLVLWAGDSSPALGERYLALAILGVICLLLTISTGQFIGFINLSSLHAFYSSRLARTFLGASNRQRFPAGSNVQTRSALLSVAEAIRQDDLSLERYYSSVCAPIHLINVTMNLNMDPAEQLVQRDRKGKPLCIAPSISAPVNMAVKPTMMTRMMKMVGMPQSAELPDIGASFILDGQARHRDMAPAHRSEIDQAHTVSHWIATSGAAFTTGLGRATSLGTSLALGLANIRLGTWWPSRFEKADTGLLDRLFKTQKYLFHELAAHFNGLHREYQYLSDGGHFENTAAYELLRGPRRIKLIVVCDSGCDPHYRFDDLTNLIRLARIDQALEIKVDTAVLGNPILAPYFGKLEDFAPVTEPGNQRCAVLLNVYDIATGALRCRVLLLKPRGIKGLTADVWNYAMAHPAFPNESTGDQFFDEAQFESYRQLGLAQGRLLFGEGGHHTLVSQTLWKYLGA